MIKIERLEAGNTDISSCNCCHAKNYKSDFPVGKLQQPEDIYILNFGSDFNRQSTSVCLCMTHLVELIKAVDECFPGEKEETK